MPQGSGTWLGTTLKFTINEARAARPGNAAMLGRLTELMFVEILREYMQRLPDNQGGWLAGLNDPHVGKALRLLHANPQRSWTVEELAREVAVSRSVLAQRFTELVGEAPMRYLANWRMQLAKQMMREGATQHPGSRDTRRLRLRSRLQSSVQASDRLAAGDLAQKRARHGLTLSPGTAARPYWSSLRCTPLPTSRLPRRRDERSRFYSRLTSGSTDGIWKRVS